MSTGTVKWFNSQKGFGFIQPDDGGKDVFVHISAVERAGMSNLNEGQKLSYELTEDKRSGKTSADQLRAVYGMPRHESGLSRAPGVSALHAPELKARFAGDMALLDPLHGKKACGGALSSQITPMACQGPMLPRQLAAGRVAGESLQAAAGVRFEYENPQFRLLRHRRHLAAYRHHRQFRSALAKLLPYGRAPANAGALILVCRKMSRPLSRS